MPERKWKLEQTYADGHIVQIIRLDNSDSKIVLHGVDLATARKVAVHEDMYDELKAIEACLDKCPKAIDPAGMLESVRSVLRLADTGKE